MRENDEGRPTEEEVGLDENHNPPRRINPLQRDQGFERRWRREYPEQVDSIEQARTVGQVGRAIAAAVDPKVCATVERWITICDERRKAA